MCRLMISRLRVSWLVMVTLAPLIDPLCQRYAYACEAVNTWKGNGIFGNWESRTANATYRSRIGAELPLLSLIRDAEL
jgi:hypothetical protein